MKNIAAASALEDLHHLIALRALAPTLAPAQRREVDRIARALEARIGPAVPKGRAAAVLGISVQALEEWIRRGRIATRRPEGAKRTGVDTGALVWTAQRIPPGTARPGRAVDRALERASFWRFNEAVTAADVRAFAALPFARRVDEIDALNASLADLAAIRLRPAAEAEAHGR